MNSFLRLFFGFKNFREILLVDPEIKDEPNAVQMPKALREIEYQDVTFGYGEDKILNGLNLKVQHGEKIALVGPSGSGKTTISALLPRFYEVDSGAIMIDGENIKIYNCVHFVQKLVLYNKTSFIFRHITRKYYIR